MGLQVRVVSMPCVKRFLSQDVTYRDHVLPSDLESGLWLRLSTAGWYQIAGRFGSVVAWTSLVIRADRNVYNACGNGKQGVEEKLIAQQ